jgi:threonyl-tRNA synthetase
LMAEQIEIKIEGSTFSVDKRTPLSELLSRFNPGGKALLAKVNGQLVSLDTPLMEKGEVEWIDERAADALEVLRHSASHLLAHAVLDLFPGTQTGIGPAVENGFYYDFLRDEPFTPDDLKAIEEKMREIAQKDVPIERVMMTKKQALRLFEDLGQHLKVELIQDKGGDEVSCYRQGDFIDFCLGPHLPSSGYIKHFRLLSVSGAYWKGEEKGKQLQRIYGTAFFSGRELDDYLARLEEAKQRDHRKLGPELDLFSFNEKLGPGLILWHPKGAATRRAIEEYWYEEHFKDGYEIIYSPHIAKLDVWRQSGHTEFYDAMYPPLLQEGVEYELKPMNCPFHIMVYNSRPRSYRDLPFRWAELGTVYRFERSGVLHGLMRVRGFTQDDAHIFCREDQLEEEIKGVISLALKLLNAFGFEEFDVFLSTCPDKYCGLLDDWNKATQALEKAMKGKNLAYQIDPGAGVFYGPKIDIKIKDALQRSWQCTTIQLDFNLAERFDLSYVGEDGKTRRPYLLHRALLGSLERFFGVLIEHYKGNFPVWMAPVQVIFLPIADRHNDYVEALHRRFRDAGLRTSADLRREKISYKIRDAETHKIPLMCVVGDKEVSSGAVSFRVHGGGEKGAMDANVFLEKVRNLVKNKSLSITM